MPADIEFKLEGIEELISRQSNLNSRIGPIVRELLEKTAYGFEAKAKYMAPVDTGKLRSSITSQIDAQPLPLWAQTGTNVVYARSVEYGSRPHYAPIDRLGKWAKAHGLTAGQVWNAIWMRGTQPHPFFKPAFEWSKKDIEKHIEEAVREIEGAWQ